MRLFLLLCLGGLIVLSVMALVKYEPWKLFGEDERLEYSAPQYPSEEPYQPPAAVAAAPAAPEPPKAERPPAATIDERVAEDAAAVGMTTMEPEDEEAPAVAAAPAPKTAPADEPIV